MSKVRRLAAVCGLSLIVTVLLAGVAVAADQRAVLFLETRPSAKPEQGYVLAARLVATDGRPVNEATVRFYDLVEFFGAREMLIGSATTDGQGIATLTYLPAQLGPRAIVAKFAGRAGVAATEGRASLAATVAAQPYTVEPAPLSAFSSKVPYAVGAIVLAVWALIGFALIGTARGVMTGARKEGKGQTA